MPMKTQADILKELKLQYDLKDSDEKLLSFISKAEREIMNYCNIPCVWDVLDQVWIDLSFDLITVNKSKISQEQVVKSISEGNTSISFETHQPKTDKEVFDSYQQKLNRFRRLRW